MAVSRQLLSSTTALVHPSAIAALAFVAGLSLWLPSPGHADEFTVSNQVEFDAAVAAAITNGVANIINLEGAAVVAPGSGLTSPVGGQPLDLNVGAGGTLGVDGVSAYVSALSGSGTIDLGTGKLTATVGAGDTSSFSGTINSLNYSYTNPYGSFVKLGAGTLIIDDSDMNRGEGAVNQGAFAVTSGTANWDTMMVGSGAGADGHLNVSGGTLNIGVALRVGDFGGTGTVTQTGGTVDLKADCPTIANCVALNIGNQGGTGTYDISGGQLILEGGSHSIGRNSGANAAGTGFLNISGDALVELRPNADIINDRGFMVIGDRDKSNDGVANSNGTIDQTGGTFRVMAGSELYLAGWGHGTYNLDGGTLEIGGDSLKGVYNSVGGTYDFNLGGGTIKVIGSQLVTSVDAELTGGTSTIDTNGLGATWNGTLSGAGNLTKTGAGTLLLNAANSFTGDVGIDAGSLQLGNASALNAQNDVNIATAGTLDVNNFVTQIGALSGSGTIDLGTGTLVTTIGENEARSFSGTIKSDNYSYTNPYGTFAKNGAGTLIIDNSTMEKGEGAVTAGAFAVTSGTAKWDTMMVGTGSGSAELNVSGGTLNIGVALRVGDFGGTGTVNQTGGTVMLKAACPTIANCVALNVGNQGGTGIYDISGDGKLILEGGSHSIGRNEGSRAAGNGTLNISENALVELRPNTENPDTDRGFMVIGDRSQSNQGIDNSSGTINQSGGTFRVMAGSQLYLAGYGKGTYNLDGGTLEIGGSSLMGVYNNVGGTYDFNLGGGTIKVIGSQLVTSVDAELTGGTSTIDTNGFGASWTGALTGAGALRKTGTGTLVLGNAGNNYAGGTVFDGGTIQANNAGAIGTGAFSVVSDSTLAFGSAFALGNTASIAEGVTATIDTSLGAGTLNGVISGAGGLTKTGANSLTLGAANTYSGATTINQGTLATAVANALSTSTAVTIASGAALDLQGNSQTIGSLNGAGNVSLGAGFLTTGSDNASTSFGGVISGSGGLTKTGTGRFELFGDSLYTGDTNINGGILAVNGSITSDVFVNAGGTLGGKGTTGDITVLSGGILAPGNSVDTLHAVGNVTLSDGALYEVETNALTSDRTEATGNVTVDGDLQINTAAGYTVGREYKIFTANGAVSGKFDTVDVLQDLPFLVADIDYNAQDVVLTFNPLATAWSAFADTSNQAGVAKAVQSLGLGDLVFDTILGLNAAQANQTFDRLSGEVHASTSTMLISDSRFVREAALERARAPIERLAPVPAMPVKAAPPPQAVDQSNGVWAKGFGSWGDWDGNGNAASLDRDIGGIFVGYDRVIGETWRFGVAAGYSEADFHVSDRASSGNAKSYHVAGYGAGNWGDFGVRFGGAYSWNDISTDRSVVLADGVNSLSADYSASTAQVFGEVGYTFAAALANFEPFASLAYVNLDTDGFTENGGAAALTTRDASEGVTYSILGVRVEAQLAPTATLKGSLGWQHAFGDTTPERESAFASGSLPFIVTGVPIAEDALVVEAGLDYAILPNTVLGVSYSGQLADEATDNSLKGSVVVKF
ncbi:autotransporter domain-containing protein [Starkeya sp. ORNL1]|uniref:autotransporter domain-containing protein n=1 Tax=Starkeya sp. ORNL1 TaxID=2709380 RepID=UPI001462C0A5|nr:autotransporter domain-containing protein [Starkeya sp. ORNL1]QJP15205.1 autotransporter domain-containing protein [Starkeya sp. ORNL1]